MIIIDEFIRYNCYQHYTSYSESFSGNRDPVLGVKYASSFSIKEINERSVNAYYYIEFDLNPTRRWFLCYGSYCSDKLIVLDDI